MCSKWNTKDGRRKTIDDRHRASHIPFRCSAETAETVSRIAAERRLPKSEVLRQLVEKGLVAEGYKQDEDSMRTAMQAALKEILTPQVERLATISAKSTQLSGAAFFLLTFIGRLYLPEDEKGMIDEVAADARKLGIEYLKLKNRDIDAFIEGGIKRMAGEQ